MIIHHLTTIALVLISHLTSFSRIGTVTFFLHDISDIFLESAKCIIYSSKAKGQAWLSNIADVFFAIFAISFFILRLVIYPKLVVYSMIVESKEMLGTWVGYYVISSLLSVLVCLHIFWFSLIAKMIYKLLTSGIEKDERSDDEDDLSELLQSQPTLPEATATVVPIPITSAKPVSATAAGGRNINVNASAHSDTDEQQFKQQSISSMSKRK